MADSGNFVLTELGIAAVPVRDAKAAKGVILQNATATFQHLTGSAGTSQAHVTTDGTLVEIVATSLPG